MFARTGYLYKEERWKRLDSWCIYGRLASGKVSKAEIKLFKEQMSNRFKMSDLGLLLY